MEAFSFCSPDTYAPLSQAPKTPGTGFPATHVAPSVQVCAQTCQQWAMPVAMQLNTGHGPQTGKAGASDT